MPDMRKHTAVIVLALATILVLAAVGRVGASPPTQGSCPGNLLANPSFEGGSRKTEGEGTSLSSAVADGWFPWFVRGNASANREPEFKVEQVAIGGDPYRIRSGGQSQKWFTTWATHTAGIYQKVAVPRGATVQLTIYAMAYSGEADGWNPEHNTFFSDPEKPGNYSLSVGIDPTGAAPPAVGAPPPDSVVWSPDTMTPDQWVPISVTAAAQGGAVTVYARGAPAWGVKHNDSFWDDACLVVVGRAAGSGAGSSSSAGGASARKASSAPRFNPMSLAVRGNHPIPR
jgi:hypothetical protein